MKIVFNVTSEGTHVHVQAECEELDYTYDNLGVEYSVVDALRNSLDSVIETMLHNTLMTVEEDLDEVPVG